jgi:hypothetical protein
MPAPNDPQPVKKPNPAAKPAMGKPVQPPAKPPAAGKPAAKGGDGKGWHFRHRLERYRSLKARTT